MIHENINNSILKTGANMTNHNLKKFNILLKRYFIKVKNSFKNSFIAILLFFLSIIIFFLILFPSFFSILPQYDHLIKYNQFSYELELLGEVPPIPGKNWSDITVFVGGYKTKLDEKGNFKLSFSADEKKMIPIVLSDHDNIFYTQFVTFENNEFSKEFEIKIDK